MAQPHPDPRVWFITGVSSGFGLQLSLLVLRAGHHVIGTSRSPSPSLTAQFASANGTVLALDVVGKPFEVAAVMEKALSIHGRIDVLVNNAGYSLLGAVEDMSDAESRLQMDTNFFAPLALIRTIIPSMRARKSGTIVNISSAQGINGIQSTGLYSASKFALEGLSESLAKELDPFGIRVLIIEPGGFRTDFNTNIHQPTKPISAAYKNTTVDFILSSVQEWHGKQLGDVEKGCQVIFDAVTGKVGEGLLRIPMGSDCVSQVREKIDSLEASLRVLGSVTGRTDIVDVE